MIYAFNGIIAKDAGVSSAIVFQHIAYWIKYNAIHEQNFINGRYWMYDTVANMHQFLNFLSEHTIKRAISKLVETGYLISDELSQDKYNHTKWYTLTDKGAACASLDNSKNSKIDSSKMEQSRKGHLGTSDSSKMEQSTIIQNNTRKGTQQSNTADPFCTGSPALDDALHGFEEMRKKLRKPLTVRAKELILKKLEKLAPGDEATQAAILDQSVERGWQGVFPLKEDNNWQKRNDVPPEYQEAEKAIQMINQMEGGGDDGGEIEWPATLKDY